MTITDTFLVHTASPNAVNCDVRIGDPSQAESPAESQVRPLRLVAPPNSGAKRPLTYNPCSHLNMSGILRARLCLSAVGGGLVAQSWGILLDHRRSGHGAMRNLLILMTVRGIVTVQFVRLRASRMAPAGARRR